MKLFVTTDYGIREFQYYDGTPTASAGVGYLEFYCVGGTIYKVRTNNLIDCVNVLNKSIAWAGQASHTALIIDSDKLVNFSKEKDCGGHVYVTTNP